jgi:hypothetical protein
MEAREVMVKVVQAEAREAPLPPVLRQDLLALQEQVAEEVAEASLLPVPPLLRQVAQEQLAASGPRHLIARPQAPEVAVADLAATEVVLMVRSPPTVASMEAVAAPMATSLLAPLPVALGRKASLFSPIPQLPAGPRWPRCCW